MCLLIVQKKDTNFTDEHLADFYTRNQDGIGVMWAEGGALHYNKIIPTSAQQAIDFYNANARGKDCAVHYRMRTHGDIDHENCHPYEVFGFSLPDPQGMPMLLMHNGILHTGNAADKSKSDTWHYIRVYLHKLLASDPSLAFSQEFKDIISKHIGSNRFVLMNHLGETAIINKYQGVNFNGAWLSNEYAWSASKYLPRPAPTYYSGTGGQQGNWGKWNPNTRKFEEDGYDAKKPASVAPIGKKTKKQKPKQQDLFKSTNNGGRKITQANLATTTEKNVCNGVSVDCRWLDDILEIRSLLDAFYVDNGTSNKQIECMIEEMGITKAYLAVELLGDSAISERAWDSLSCNRAEMKYFASQPMSHWYPNRTVGTL